MSRSAVAVPGSFAPPVAMAVATPPRGTARPSPRVHADAPIHTGVDSLASAAVIGAPGAVVAVAAACAGELRARERAAAALVCIWRPAQVRALLEDPGSDVAGSRSPAGATTPAARRLADRLAGHGLAATACGRLAWLALDPDPAAAVGELARCAALTSVPWVLAVAGPRPEQFESLLADVDLSVAVLAPDADPALRALAAATPVGRGRAVVAPLPPGPPRWTAMAGLARLRTLPDPRP